MMACCLGDLLADPRAEDEFEQVSRRAAAKGVPALLALLSDRERLVVSRRFGLDGEARTLRDIAGDLGVSAERVRQIEERALETLRTAWPATGELEFAAPSGSTISMNAKVGQSQFGPSMAVSSL